MDEIKIEIDICFAIRTISGVQQAKLTREKVLTQLNKIDKDLQVDIFTRKFQELINRQFNEIQREGEQESLFILKNITDFIDFDEERATAHTAYRGRE